ncbi:hypothetical protein BJF79_42570 [Actinomadura sp. CNU-125]|nr:hypothetical protein BJF79_42570 [Actinomadura sp. CNU-125]
MAAACSSRSGTASAAPPRASRPFAAAFGGEPAALVQPDGFGGGPRQVGELGVGGAAPAGEGVLGAAPRGGRVARRQQLARLVDERVEPPRVHVAVREAQRVAGRAVTRTRAGRAGAGGAVPGPAAVRHERLRPAPARGGAVPAHRSSTSVSAGTIRPCAAASRASTDRRRRPPRSAGAPSTTAPKAPSTLTTGASTTVDMSRSD